jgi:hypothetical protein
MHRGFHVGIFAYAQSYALDQALARRTETQRTTISAGVITQLYAANDRQAAISSYLLA